MTSCLLCASGDMERGSWLRVHYDSARSDEKQTTEGKVVAVTFHKDGPKKVTIKRSDGQKMTIHSNGRIVSHGSHHPTTGYANRFEVKTPHKAEA